MFILFKVKNCRDKVRSYTDIYILVITVGLTLNLELQAKKRDYIYQPFLFSALCKIWARPEAVAAGHTEYAQSITGKILTFYENTFKMKYPLNKLGEIKRIFKKK